MKYEIPTEKIISFDKLREISLGELCLLFEELKIERMPKKNRHEMNWSSLDAQYWPQVQDPIISFSSKSLVLGLNSKQVCKIRLDNKVNIEIKNYQLLKNDFRLFPRFDGVIEFSNGWKGIILERIYNINKFNYTSGELNGMYYNFYDDLTSIHMKGILHNDLIKSKGFEIRPNIIISKDRIRLIDCEKLLFKSDTPNWEELLKKEQEQLNAYFLELIDFKCHTLT
tara:strand:- start:90 stop:767 length:678 start_codon:yes stop_codon:yes gene_type:complete